MPNELTQKYLDALRSGRFKQCRGSLHCPDTHGYCALGVLCKLYKEEFHEGDFYNNGRTFLLTTLLDGNDMPTTQDYMPQLILDAFGITLDYPQIVQMNDGSSDLSLAQIADEIELLNG